MPREDAAALQKLRDLALARMDRMLGLIPKLLRAEKPRHIHDFRVASRRFQQVFEVLNASPLPPPMKRLRGKIKRSRRIFSDVRNCDVMIQSIEKRLARRRAGHREAWHAVLGYLKERRSRAYDRALRKMTQLNLDKTYVRLRGVLLSAPRSGAGDGDGGLPRPALPAGDGQLRLRVIEELDKAWRRFEAEFRKSQQSSSADLVHRARIAGKKLRYLIEVMGELGFPGCNEANAWLRELQQYLGDWHDLDVAEQMMIEMLARPQFLRDHLEIAPGILKLIAGHRNAKAELAVEYREIELASGGGKFLQEWVHALLCDRIAHAHAEEAARK